MNNHDTIHRLAIAYKRLSTAEEMVTSGLAIEAIRTAKGIVYEVGEEHFGESFRDEISKAYEDC